MNPTDMLTFSLHAR